MPRMAQDQVKSLTQTMKKRDPEREAAATQRVLDTINRIMAREPEILEGDIPIMNEWETVLRTGLASKPAASRTAAELIPVFVELARVARREGLVAMENFAEQAVDDELLRLGLRMTIGGTDMNEVMDILGAKKTTMVQAYERRLAMIIAAVDGIGSGLNPSLMQEKCKAFLQ